MKNQIGIAVFLLMAWTLAAAGQSSAKLPCDYSGKLLRRTSGGIVRFDSDEMKDRAIHKVEISDFLKRTDIKGTALVELLIGPSGEVVCTKTVFTHPIRSSELENAVGAWTFRPEKVNGEDVPYVARMEFYLCNISCGDQGISVSIVK